MSEREGKSEHSGGTGPTEQEAMEALANFTKTVGKAKYENGKVIPMDSLYEWGRWMEKGKRKIADTFLPDGTNISTVFLGINHGWGKKDLWFETMVFGGEHDGDCARYETVEEALNGHRRIVDEIRGAT